MSCPFYKYDNGYACTISHERVNEDVYYKFCRNYDYRDCPWYRTDVKHPIGDKQGGCFITSACTEAKGLPDDCYELTVLRGFRDNYMRNTTKGQSEIEEYYLIAPPIVDHIKRGDNPGEVLNTVYEQLVKPCVLLVELGKNEQAHALYREYVTMLKNRYLA